MVCVSFLREVDHDFFSFFLWDSYTIKIFIYLLLMFAILPFSIFLLISFLSFSLCLPVYQGAPSKICDNAVSQTRRSTKDVPSDKSKSKYKFHTSINMNEH